MNATHSPDSTGGLSTTRIEAFSDGVFAIVMTLLIFEVKVPELAPGMMDIELLPALLRMWPKYLSFVVSFVVTGIYWVAHHNTFHLIRRTDRPLLWFNLMFLLCVAFIPFPTALMGTYVGTPIAVVPYGLTLIATGVSLRLLWAYASTRRRLVAHDLPDELIRAINRRMLMGPVAYAIAILISIFSATLTLWLYAVVPVAYIVPQSFDRLFARHARKP